MARHIHLLVVNGWQCRLKPTSRELLAPYNHTDDPASEIFYIKEKASKFMNNYGLALNTAHLHKRDVEHFRTEGFYKALVEGKPYSSFKFACYPNEFFEGGVSTSPKRHS